MLFDESALLSDEGKTYVVELQAGSSCLLNIVFDPEAVTFDARLS